ncbi:MAG TPA: response regulator [Candidatus Limnocylindria bacterium]|nr:response regulator [Candidatus Limnocylindria bacterium]
MSSLFEDSGDPLLVIDSLLHVTECNPAAARFLCTTREKLKGAPVLEIDLLARLLTAASVPQRLKSERSPVVDEVAVTDAEGQALQCRIEALALRDGRTLLHLTDTTQSLRARAALKAAEHLHRAIFDALPEVCWTMALPEERLLEVSPAVERLFGYQPADFRHKPELWDELVHPADRERVRAELRAGLSAARPFEIHFTGLHRDHRDLPHLVNRVVPVVDEQGWTDRCEGFIEDLGAHRSLETSLRATRANLRHTLESVSSGVLVVYPDTHGPQVVACNRHLADMLHLDEPIRPGTPLAQTHPELRSLVYGAGTESEFDRRLLSDEVRDETAELSNPHRVLRRYTGPVRDEHGMIVGRILTVENVTSSWLMQRRLTHAQKMESMGRLAGGAAHDFNNLLGTILGFSSLLLEQTPAGDPRREPLEQIAQSAERASNLTAALLTFSRSARFERLPVNLNRIVEDSYQIVRSMLDPSVAVQMRLEPALPMLQGDALLLQQVVVNLVQELRERLLAGGTLHLSTRVFDQARPAEEQDLEPKPQRMVALEIQAGGQSPDVRSLGVPPTGSSEGAAGLALTIVEDIARAHGGYVVAHASSDTALYDVVFPAEPHEETPLMTPEPATARGHETILFVDDEPGLRALAKAGLRQRGFDVVTVESGEQALDILRKGDQAVDVVLLDLSMPGLSGEKVLRAIRGFQPDLPVIIASGYATVQSQSAWVAAGASGFLAKPYRIQDVALKLREVLDRAHGATK